jgi:murein DD-endopeptidase MepM/ murein hydrolase activator NlpD
MRFHPILQTWKAHKGIDYAAPTGTAVHTVGKGVVKSAGWINGLGNVVFVDHGNSQTTVYAHLSEISVRPAQVIEQGQKIGAVGDTGWATGPHLHFEFRINDQYKDPSTIARQSTPIVLSKSALADFNQQASAIRLQLSRNNNDIDDPISLNQ